MASRRFLFSLSRRLSSSVSSNPSFTHHLPTIPIPIPIPIIPVPKQPLFNYSLLSRHFSSSHHSTDDEEVAGDSEFESEFESEEDENDHLNLLSPEQISKKAAHIGYQVVGPVREADYVEKPYEPVFAVVQIGAHQFKVSNGDSISTEKLKYCDVNEKLILNKVLMLGSRTQTIIGRPILPDASVHVVVEEHALDAKVIIFKKKRRKNYRRKNGHRQELTRLRVIDIQGIEKPEIPEPIKVESESMKHEKVAVAA